MLIIPAILDSHRSLKDKTIKITFETNELDPNQLVELAKHIQRFGWLAFKEDMFKEDEKELLKSLKSEYQEQGKTKSQRLRAVMYKNFEQDSLGYKVFDDFYNRKMEELINHFKSKLD
jgi:hypothetical protein